MCASAKAPGEGQKEKERRKLVFIYMYMVSWHRWYTKTTEVSVTLKWSQITIGIWAREEEGPNDATGRDEV